MSKPTAHTTVIDPKVTFIEKEYERVAKDNAGLSKTFDWSNTVKPFEVFTLYSDKTPTTSSSNTVIFK